MLRFLTRRLAAALLLLLLLLTLTFFILHLAPGEPAVLMLDLGDGQPRITPEQREHLRALYGLDRPLLVQYGAWLRALLLRGDWGTSFSHRRPVIEVIVQRLPSTLELAGAALVVEYTLGLLLGVLAARRAGSRTDHAVRFGSLLVYSLPLFWLGLMAILLLAARFPIFPPGLKHAVDADQMSSLARLADLLHHLALPALVLGVVSATGVSRFARNSLLDALGEDYVRTARAKGLSERRVLWVHALRNAAGPLVQLLGVSLPALLSGSLVTEVVFSWPGMGQLTYNAISTRDYPLILATTLLTGALVVVGSLVADLLQAALDPRVRHAA